MQKIALVGATGDLGFRILTCLVRLGAKPLCIARKGSKSSRLTLIRDLGVEVAEIDLYHHDSLTQTLDGCSVVVSTVSGLESTIVDFQTLLLKASVEAGVQRFFPSDFSIDYRPILQGENRNLNLRNTFREIIDAEKRIQATSILNGAFMDMLSGTAPFILFPIKRVLCWGSPTQLMDWTTIDDTALYTAHAIIDNATPRYLNIAGDQISAESLAKTMSEITKTDHKVLKAGSLKTFKQFIRFTKFLSPDNQTIYPAWQGMQYMYNMYEGRCKHQHLDNARYPVTFTDTKTFLSKYINGEIKKYTPNNHA